MVAQLVGGHVDSSVKNAIEAVSQWRAGELRPLCVFDGTPMPFKELIAGDKSWADIPTCTEAGQPIEFKMMASAVQHPGQAMLAPRSLRQGRDRGRGRTRDRGPCGRHLSSLAYADPGHPGPLLFTEQKEFVWGLIASMYLGNVVGLFVALATVPLFASILPIPFSTIVPVILVVCAVGAFTVNNALIDLSIMPMFGVVGYLLKKLDFPLASMVVALVLGDMAEFSFRQSMLLSRGSQSIFRANPLLTAIMALALILLFWPLLIFVRDRFRSPAPARG